MSEQKQEPRKYTMAFEGGETVEKTAEELTGEQVYACEKVNALNTEIGRLNASLADNVVLRDHYQVIAAEGFKEQEEEKEEDQILYRKSHKGKDVKIYFKPYEFDDDIPNSTSKKFVVWANGAILLKTDSLKAAEDKYTTECKKHYKDTHGRFMVGRHTIVNGVIKTLGEEV